RIREEAKSDAKAILSEAHSKAKADAAASLDAAQRQIASERRSAEISLRQDVGTLATELAERIVGEALQDAALSQRVVDRFLAELEATPSPTAAKE
ncbi:MAG: F0F1 ATP synthase subunit B, partial [Micrococcales bacterium]|nr:F0F1 ATP synthase subunit B [Micrococcales bacterium]